ncbi:MAG: hypothetical protein A2X64_03885 [Ignavibacteria bacterium GWF2_33_9]|nr:MAG: hypothetical protein A2X64_03885 [Ignavibacteria bacterium GWF2_33_9]
MDWYLKVLKQYVDFNGRARRKEYWMFVLINFIFMILASILDYIIGTYFVIYSLYALAILLPALAVGIRRLHDLGKSGWWIFISLIPLIGAIWLLILMFTEGQRQANEYGPDPKVEL